MHWLLVVIVLSGDPARVTVAPSYTVMENEAQCDVAAQIAAMLMNKTGARFVVACAEIDPAKAKKDEAPDEEKKPAGEGPEHDS